MKTLLTSLCLLLASGAAADGLPSFDFIGAAALRAAESGAAPVPTPPSKAGDVIDADHLYLQAGTKVLFGYADDAVRFHEAAAYWTAALTAAGVSVGAAEWKDGMFTLAYATADGRAIRAFAADPRQFRPKDESDLRLNMAASKAGLAEAGLTPLVERVVNLPDSLPTYVIFYLTKPDAAAEHETRLRVLKTGEEPDFDIFRTAGLDILQTPKPWLMVYIGPEVGYVTMAAVTREGAEEGLAERRKILLDARKRVIAGRILPVDQPDFKFLVELYFYQ